MVLRPGCLQSIVHVRGQDNEDLVRIDRIKQRRAFERREPRDQAARHRVGVLGIGKPQPIGEIGVELRRQQPHFREQVPAALAPELELLGEIGVEEDHDLRAHRAVLGGAEAEHIDAGLPRQFGRRAIDVGEGVGETRAIHVELEALAMRRGRDRCYFLGSIGSAAFGRLGDRHRRRLRMMHDAVDRLRERIGEFLRIDLAGGAVDRLELGTGIELGRVGLVDSDVGGRMAVDRAPRRCAAREREHVRRGSRGDGEGEKVRLLEDLAQALLDLLGPFVGAVGMDGAGAEGTAHGLDDQRMGADLVVATKIHQRAAPGGNSTVPSRAPVRGSTM